MGPGAYSDHPLLVLSRYLLEQPAIIYAENETAPLIANCPRVWHTYGVQGSGTKGTKPKAKLGKRLRL